MNRIRYSRNEEFNFFSPLKFFKYSRRRRENIFLLEAKIKLGFFFPLPLILISKKKNIRYIRMEERGTTC